MLLLSKRNSKLCKPGALWHPESVPDPLQNIWSQMVWRRIPCVLKMPPRDSDAEPGLEISEKASRLMSLMSPWIWGSISFWSLATIDWYINHITLCRLEKADNWQHCLPHCSDESQSPLRPVINYPFVCTGGRHTVLFNREGREFGHNINSC